MEIEKARTARHGSRRLREGEVTTIRWGTVVLIIVGVALLTPALVHLIKLVIL